MAEQRNDGGPAFPRGTVIDERGDIQTFPGMSLREWYAGQALPGIILATSAGQHMPQMRPGEGRIAHAIARDAVEMADAMIAALKESAHG